MTTTNAKIPEQEVENNTEKEKDDKDYIVKVLALIRKAEQKQVAKRKIIEFLKKKGINESKIIAAYERHYKEEVGLFVTTSKEGEETKGEEREGRGEKKR
ncbi:hypothetical protein RFI_28445 [Reticulomyxa filosa]|uniref:Uncharacterized protein n=1 Tax=Reticulomyxa filosa TaxID=46433 RepID=X6M4W6_RETFI|nr:hypothetical protein RFI_28445 [Reticulomyxa filosa]|eukprot:ETO08939.1 hypothetical protein RFI_28445 [Reticulomyxa filosa]